MATHFTAKHIKLVLAISLFHNFFISGLEGTVRISRLFNDNNKAKELMLWWSTNVGNRISDLKQNKTKGEDDIGDISISSKNETVKGTCYL